MLLLCCFMLHQCNVNISLHIHACIHIYTHTYIHDKQIYVLYSLIFTRVIRKRSTEEFSCIPYIVALSNCLLYTWYGLPVVSYKWENFPVVTINGLGIILELSFIFIYLWFAPTRGKASFLIKPCFSFPFFIIMWSPLTVAWWKNLQIKAGSITTMVMVIFTVTAIISAFVFHDHHHRKVFVGTIGLVASVAMYAAPLVVVVSHLKKENSNFFFQLDSCHLRVGIDYFSLF